MIPLTDPPQVNVKLRSWRTLCQEPITRHRLEEIDGDDIVCRSKSTNLYLFGSVAVNSRIGSIGRGSLNWVLSFIPGENISSCVVFVLFTRQETDTVQRIIRHSCYEREREDGRMINCDKGKEVGREIYL